MDYIRVLKIVLQAIVIGAIFFLMGKILYSNWHNISLNNIQINKLSLVISFFVLIIYFFLYANGWLLILRYLKVDLEFNAALKIFFYSQPGKYLPGKIWSFLGQAYFAEKYGVSKIKIFYSNLLMTLLSMLAGLAIFIVASIFEKDFKINDYFYLLLPLVMTLLFFLHPKIFKYLITTVLKFFNKTTPNIDLTFQQMVSVFIYVMLMWFVIGVGFHFLVNSFTILSYTKMPILVGSLSIAGSIGIISFITPGGIGVREGILVLLLSNILTMPMAVLASLSCRVWLITGELVLLVIAYKLPAKTP